MGTTTTAAAAGSSGGSDDAVPAVVAPNSLADLASVAEELAKARHRTFEQEARVEVLLAELAAASGEPWPFRARRVPLSLDLCRVDPGHLLAGKQQKLNHVVLISGVH